MGVPKTMHAVVVSEAGGPEVLHPVEVAVPAVRPGWSLVRVRAFGLNHSEVFTRQGLSPSVRFPRILGIECVGEVAVTTDPHRLPEGQQVVSIMGEMGRAFDGSYAEYVLLPNEQVYPVRTSLPWDVLAAVPETYHTAFGSLRNLRLGAGQSVLVRGATSGVGLAFARLARATGLQLRLVGTTRDATRGQRLRDSGFDDVVLDRDGHLHTDERFDRGLELVGPATLKDTCAHMRRGAIVCSTGQLGGQWYMDGFDPIMDLPEDGYLTSFYSGNVSGSALTELLAFVETRDIDATPERIFTLAQLPEAHRWLEGPHGFGKAVVVNG